MKYAQLEEIQEATAKGYIDELVKKYAEGSVIVNMPSNIDGSNAGLVGELLRDSLILKVSVLKNVVLEIILEYSYDKKILVLIRDIIGYTYSSYMERIIL